MRIIAFMALLPLITMATASSVMVNFTQNTPENGSVLSGNILYVNISTTSNNETYTFTDLDNSLILFLRMDDTNSLNDTLYDESTYGNNGSIYKCRGTTYTSCGTWNTNQANCQLYSGHTNECYWGTTNNYGCVGYATSDCHYWDNDPEGCQNDDYHNSACSWEYSEGSGCQNLNGWVRYWYNTGYYGELGDYIETTSYPDLNYNEDYGLSDLIPGYADWVGYVAYATVNIDSSDYYDFSIGSDDGIRLFVDTNPILDQYGPGGYRTSNTNIWLDAGEHTYEIDYYELWGGAQAMVSLPGTIISNYGYEDCSSYDNTEDCNNNGCIWAGDYGSCDGYYDCSQPYSYWCNDNPGCNWEVTSITHYCGGYLNCVQYPKTACDYLSGCVWDTENVSQTNGKFGIGMHFNGTDSNQNIRLGYSENVYTPFTLSLWVKPSTDCINAYQGCGILGNANYWSGGYHLGFYIGALAFDFEHYGYTNANVYNDLSDFNSELWTNIVAQYNGSSLLLFVNGDFKNQTSANALTDFDSQLTLGYDHQGGWSYPQFSGSIDDFLFFNRTLSTTEIKSLYNSTKYRYDMNLLNLDSNLNHTIKGYGVESGGTWNTTENRTYSFGLCSTPSNNADWIINCENNCTYQNFNKIVNNIVLTETRSGFMNFVNNNISLSTITPLNQTCLWEISQNNLFVIRPN